MQTALVLATNGLVQLGTRDGMQKRSFGRHMCSEFEQSRVSQV